MERCRFFTGYSAAARAVSAAFVLAVAGCATTPPAPPVPKTAEQVVMERAQKKWDALLKGDIEAAYAYLSPGSKAVVPLQGYRESIRPGFWQGAKVEKVVCAGPESCEVALRIEYVVRGSKVAAPLSETWIRQDAEWWFVQK